MVVLEVLVVIVVVVMMDDGGGDCTGVFLCSTVEVMMGLGGLWWL